MDAAVRQEIEGLRKLKTKQLKLRYRELFQEESASSNHQHLFRRIAWRLAGPRRRRSERTGARARGRVGARRGSAAAGAAPVLEATRGWKGAQRWARSSDTGRRNGSEA